jgi:hypothetical protein
VTATSWSNRGSGIETECPDQVIARRSMSLTKSPPAGAAELTTIVRQQGLVIGEEREPCRSLYGACTVLADGERHLSPAAVYA